MGQHTFAAKWPNKLTLRSTMGQRLGANRPDLLQIGITGQHLYDTVL